MTASTAYVATIQFGGFPAPRTLLFEGVHPALYVATCPRRGVHGPDRPTLMHWGPIPADEAAGMRATYAALTRHGDVVTLGTLHDELTAAVEETRGDPTGILYEGRLDALLAYAETVGHDFGAAPAPGMR